MKMVVRAHYVMMRVCVLNVTSSSIFNRRERERGDRKWEGQCEPQTPPLVGKRAVLFWYGFTNIS